jgi:hypothetical protein
VSTNQAVETKEPNLSIDIPTVTRYMELAQEFLAAFDVLAAKVPKLVVKHPSTADFVRVHIGIPLKCLNTAVDVVAASEELQGLKRIKVDEARDTLQFIDAFTRVADQMEAFASALRFTINSRRADLAAAVLQIYGTTKLLARTPELAVMDGFAANIKRDLGGRGRGTKKQPETPPAGGAPTASGSAPTPLK